MGSSALWQGIRDRGVTTLAVIGMSKNTGKTVALNHLLAQAAAAGVDVGLSSIGRDGEARDEVFGIPKPPVVVWPGMVVATARDTLRRARVRWKQLAETGIASPLGEILIVRSLDHGEMEVAGPSLGCDQQRTIELLKRCGAALVVLDGALGRSQHASPGLADGVVLATGAALGGGIADVIRKTRERLAILGIDAADGETAARCRAVFEEGGVGVWDRTGAPRFRARIPTLNAASTLLRFSSPRSPRGSGAGPGGFGIATIAVSGAVGRALWQAILTLAAEHPGLTLVVADGTRLFIDHADLGAFRRQGGRLLAWRAIRIAGITLNPAAPLGGPLGGDFPADEFLAVARAAFPDRLVCDVVREQDQTETGVPQ